MSDFERPVEDELLHVEALLQAGQHHEALHALSLIEQAHQGDREVLDMVESMRATRSADPLILALVPVLGALLVVAWLVARGAHLS